MREVDLPALIQSIEAEQRAIESLRRTIEADRKERQEAAEKAAEESKRGMGGSLRISASIHSENGAIHRPIHRQVRQPNSWRVHNAMGQLARIDTNGAY